MVRATQVLQPGEEVSVSYLGTEDHAPASMRRQVGVTYRGYRGYYGGFEGCESYDLWVTMRYPLQALREARVSKLSDFICHMQNNDLS